MLNLHHALSKTPESVTNDRLNKKPYYQLLLSFPTTFIVAGTRVLTPEFIPSDVVHSPFDTLYRVLEGMLAEYQLDVHHHY